MKITLEDLNNSSKFKIIRKIAKKIIILKTIYFAFKQYIVRKILIIPPPYTDKIHRLIISSRWDPIRFSTIALAVNTIQKEQIKGSFAELGVYKGETSQIIHLLAPERKLYLFDTFEGFPSEYLEIKDDSNRYKDTSIDLIKKTIGNMKNIIIKKGIFPETAYGLENEIFSFVHLDMDLYISTKEGLEFFYPRISKGGYLVIHDYNNPNESNMGVLKAVNEYFSDKPEKIIEIPDIYGTAIIRKI
ncbi:MAG: TylF/MycF/NovP-related O-methyltransferase [Candidatus Hermodarchaeota archaeon]